MAGCSTRSSRWPGHAGLRAHLFVMLENPEAARLYERHGFVRSGLIEEHGGRLAEQLVFQAEP